MATLNRISRLPDVVNLTTTAAVLGKHRHTVAKYIENGDLKGKKVGNSWFITRQAIEEFLQLN